MPSLLQFLQSEQPVRTTLYRVCPQISQKISTAKDDFKSVLFALAPQNHCSELAHSQGQYNYLKVFSAYFLDLLELLCLLRGNYSTAVGRNLWNKVV